MKPVLTIFKEGDFFMRQIYEVPKEEISKVLSAIGRSQMAHRLAIYKAVGGKLKPSFNYVMDHLEKMGAIIEVERDFYALHPVFREMDDEAGLKACFPMKVKKLKSDKAEAVWIRSH
ncbi:hypothetical protein AZI87_17070 [Bdellovibrio bacteriovorus]|uniref:Uncharacterized protein n=1 Tax=Bdellovibrio bacteriovorus TaxID=959 RepID=A0A162G0Q0_BDEBC|nr:hypothetical protein [Bdellovibrio bacteriovorus]KYG62972.1 hypothetical protein AZI87_17070 [Bdellovibrio bacteriovorus]